MISFSRPIYLLLLLFLVPMLILHFRSYAGLSTRRRRLSLALRFLVMALLTLAAAGARWEQDRNEKCVVFVVDHSLSIPERTLEDARREMDAILMKLPREDLAAVVSVGADAVVAMAPTTGRVYSEKIPLNREETHLERGLRLAASLVPDGYAPRIVLMTDGHENAGSARRLADDLCASGVEIDVIALNPATGAEASLEEANLPDRVRVRQPFTARLGLYSSLPQKLTIRVARQNKAEGAYSYHHPGGGEQTVRIPLQAEEEGFQRYQFDVVGESDAIAANNRQEAFVQVGGARRVLVASEEPAEDAALSRVLEQAQFQVKRVHPSALPLVTGELRDFDAVVLANVAAPSLGERSLVNLRSYVRDIGGGLVMLGGPHSFGAGGYFRTPVEEVLPVTMDIRNRKEMPVSALILAIDRSGSMMSQAGGYTKLDLAKKAAVLSGELLNDYDYIGVIAFDEAAHEVVKFGRMESPGRVSTQIAALQVGGGTNMYPAMELAREWFQSIPAMNKHLILLSDGITGGTDFRELSIAINNEGVTISAVSIGDDANTQLMDMIAAAGKGRSYVTRDASDIPRIFTREALVTLKNVINENEFRPIPSAGHELLTGIDAGALPSLMGHISTTPKPHAEVLLRATEDDPLLAVVRSGLGKSLAWTSDATARWGRNWTSWPGYPQFWEQAVRWTFPEESSRNVRLTATDDGNKFHVNLDVKEKSGAATEFLEIDLRAIGPQGQIVKARMEPSGPGRYRGTVALPTRGNYLLSATTASGDGVEMLSRSGVGYSYAPEYRIRPGEEGVLPQIMGLAGAREIVNPEEILRPAAKPARRAVEIWYPLLLAAAIFFLFDIAVRRVSFKLADLLAAARPAQGPIVESAHASSVARLKTLAKKSLPRHEERMIAPAAEEKTPPSSEPPPAAPSAEPESPAPAEGTHTSRLLQAKRKLKDK